MKPDLEKAVELGLMTPTQAAAYVKAQENPGVLADVGALVTWEGTPIKVERSARRKKSYSAKLVDGELRMKVTADRGFWTDKRIIREASALETKIQAKRAIQKLNRDRPLQPIADRINRDYFGGMFDGEYTFRWVGNQNRTRWASCSPHTGEIRLSHRLADFPDFVLEAVIAHEMCHLRVLGHDLDFYNLANRYPRLVEAHNWMFDNGNLAGIAGPPRRRLREFKT